MGSDQETAGSFGPQLRNSRSVRRLLLYDFDLDGHFPDSLSVVALEQREVQNKDRERNKSADGTGQ